jgi:pimeloyl-ACP methyl ester carboxylesterase
MDHACSPPAACTVVPSIDGEEVRDRAGGPRCPARRLTAAVLLIVWLAALAAAAEASAAPLRWRDCGERGLQCASLRVPLAYAKPRGAQITIGLNRLPALDRRRRVGSLIYNPGGPGGPATAALEIAAMGRPYFTASTRNRFDIIGMDPRGVGKSTRLKCSAAIFNRPVSLFPTSAAGFSRLVAHNRALGASCVRRSGRLLRYLDARYVARDMERVRRALRDGKLNFLGLSYGTLIGMEYANLYPRRIRTMALDGLLNHAVPELQAMSDEAYAYERQLNRFFAWCDATPECALYGEGAQATWTRVIAKATAAPIPAPGCSQLPSPCRSTVTADDIRFNMQEQLFIKDPVPGLLPGWYGLAEALAAADAGDATALSTPIATGPSDLGIAGLVIACLEFAGHTTTWPQQFTKQILGRVVAPQLLGASQTWTVQSRCIGWPVPMTNPPHAIRVRGAPPILLVNSTYDPSDSYVWAAGDARQVPSGVLLTRAGDGHTSYFKAGRTRDAMMRYLITRRTPPRNTVYED